MIWCQNQSAPVEVTAGANLYTLFINEKDIWNIIYSTNDREVWNVMKKLALFLFLFAIIFSFCACANDMVLYGANQAEPFQKADVIAFSKDYKTIQDFYNLVAPCMYLLNNKALDRTGSRNIITLQSIDEEGNTLGYVQLATSDKRIYQDEGMYKDGALIPSEILKCKAVLIEANWLDQRFALPPIRGVGIGAKATEVTNAFFTYNTKEPLYMLQDLNKKANNSWSVDSSFFVGAKAMHRLGENMTSLYEFGWCTLNKPHEWRENYTLSYGVKENKVFSIILSYRSDTTIFDSSYPEGVIFP